MAKTQHAEKSTLKTLVHKKVRPCNATPFSNKEAFQKEVEPLLNELRLKCLMNEIPFAACFAVDNSDSETEYYADGLFAEVSFPKMILANDVLPEVLLAIRGAEFQSAVSKDDPAGDFIQMMLEDLPVDMLLGESAPREESISRIEYPDEE